PSPPAAWPAPPPVTAAAFLAVDAGSGQVLAAGSADQRRPVASTVKMLTALTAVRRSALDDVVTAGDEIARVPSGAGVGLDPGDTWSVEDLLEGAVARSGNDAALVLAAHVGGSVDRFVALMREDAGALGLSGLELHNPHGVDDENRLSARDLAVLTRAALQVPALADIAARPVVDLPGLGEIPSRNELLGTFEGADGVKTGFTTASGRCLIATATRDGRQLLAVVLGSRGERDHFRDVAALLDFGFASFAAQPSAGWDAAVRVPGAWLEPQAALAEILVPTEGDRVAFAFTPPIEPAGVSTIEASWDDGPLGEVPLTWTGRPAGEAERIGSWLAGRAYAAMRAATVAGAWAAAEEDV
ncbi:MAG: D-alanyl-D-alanine carboxypeptidase family protein, partial [Nitriliruptorales bacterium]